MRRTTMSKTVSTPVLHTQTTVEIDYDADNQLFYSKLEHHLFNAHKIFCMLNGRAKQERVDKTPLGQLRIYAAGVHCCISAPAVQVLTDLYQHNEEHQTLFPHCQAVFL
jgi:hypothetical protein